MKDKLPTPTWPNGSPRTDWQLVFSSSRIYGGFYAGEHLPAQHWEWPEGWLTKRLRELRQREEIEKEQDNNEQTEVA